MRVCVRGAALALIAFVAFTSGALAEKPDVPDRQIPEQVLTGMRLLDHDFARALAADCAQERCYSKGCVYVSHSVVDRPATGSLPGLYLEDGPGNGPDQLFLTSAKCSFAHEPTVSRRSAKALATRLKAKMSRGWTQVDITYEKLKSLPASLREPPEDAPPAPEPAPEPPPEPDAGVEAADAGPPPAPEALTSATAGRELWVSLLPHFAWMIALVLVTFVALILIWALRRLGRQSPEEQALLAQMLNGGGGGEGGASPPPGDEEVEDAAAQVEAQRQRWQARLSKASREGDPALAALVADLLRNNERRLLAKAVMVFPEDFPKAFPTDGALASAKYEVAEYLKHTDPSLLPSEVDFYDALNRYALASALTAHPDTDLIRGLHDEFGPGALVDLVAALPPRCGALLFALSPEAMQHEAVELLTAQQHQHIVEQLMLSNRMDPAETEYLLGVLGALKSQEALPAPPSQKRVSDRGTEYNATAALSILLPRLDAEGRKRHVARAAERLNGRLPTWLKGTLYAEMLLRLPDTERADLLLQVDVRPLSSWLQVQTAPAREALLGSAPTALRAALTAVEPPANEAARFAQVGEGRAALSAALRRRLMRGDLQFQSLLA